MKNTAPQWQPRSRLQKWLDFVTFPLRALLIFEENKWGLSSLRTDRFEFVAHQVRGHCLDVGCGRNNLFVKRHLGGRGVGVDVFPYEGLTEEELIRDIRKFPFKDGEFASVTFIGCLNHIPSDLRSIEMKEAFRCLSSGGNVIVTMGNPLAEVLVHHVVRAYDWLFKTRHDMDGERGMGQNESFFLTTSQITGLLAKSGFKRLSKTRFWTQWGLNYLVMGWKE